MCVFGSCTSPIDCCPSISSMPLWLSFMWLLRLIYMGDFIMQDIKFWAVLISLCFCSCIRAFFGSCFLYIFMFLPLTSSWSLDVWLLCLIYMVTSFFRISSSKIEVLLILNSCCGTTPRICTSSTHSEFFSVVSQVIQFVFFFFFNHQFNYFLFLISLCFSMDWLCCCP